MAVVIFSPFAYFRLFFGIKANKLAEILYETGFYVNSGPESAFGFAENCKVSSEIINRFAFFQNKEEKKQNAAAPACRRTPQPGESLKDRAFYAKLSIRK